MKAQTHFNLNFVYCTLQNVSLNLDGDLFQTGLQREKPIIWTSSVVEDRNRSNDLSTNCRNSVQGKALIVDDRGYVCTRFELLWTGCCNVEVESTKLFHCETCLSSNCCAIYEYCVSCCMHPNKVCHFVSVKYRLFKYLNIAEAVTRKSAGEGNRATNRGLCHSK